MRSRCSLRCSKTCSTSCSKAVRAVEMPQGALTVDMRPGAPKGDRRREAVKRFGQLGVRMLHLDAWAGAVDRVVKFRERGRAGRGPLDVAIRLFGFNQPVAV